MHRARAMETRTLWYRRAATVRGIRVHLLNAADAGRRGACGEGSMPGIIGGETRKRGVFGLMVLALFCVFNLLMGIWAIALFTNLQVISERSGLSGILTATVGFGRIGLLVVVWALGAGVLGALVLATRNAKASAEGARKPRQ